MAKRNWWCPRCGRRLRRGGSKAGCYSIVLDEQLSDRQTLINSIVRGCWECKLSWDVREGRLDWLRERGKAHAS